VEFGKLHPGNFVLLLQMRLSLHSLTNNVPSGGDGSSDSFP
jgi:hypothetical protein